MVPPLGRAVILAGGGGLRLWPWAGPSLPKPLLPLGGGGRTLLRATLDRVGPLAGRVLLQADAAIGRLLVETEPGLGPGDLRTEPSPRDTAGAVALAMREALDEDPAGVVGVFPADHRVADEDAFRAALRDAAAAAAEGHLALLAIRPTGPATRFGWIELGDRLPGGGRARKVLRFTEKPDRATAERFHATGRFAWNAGMFVWRADVFWRALARHAPGIAGPVEAWATRGDRDAWEAMARLPIDVALLERAEDVVAVPLDAGWDDVGSWETVLRLVEEGDAGPARALPRRGGGRGLVLDVTGGAPVGEQSVVLPFRQGEELLVVTGPHGVLVAPRAGVDRVKDVLR